MDAIAAGQHLDGPVLVVGDHHLAVADTLLDEALPPGQHRLASEPLCPEVADVVVLRHRLVPDQPAARVADLGAVLEGGALAAEEPVAARLAARALADPDRGGG